MCAAYYIVKISLFYLIQAGSLGFAVVWARIGGCRLDNNQKAKGEKMMDFANTELQLAYELDTLDELAAFRQEFVIEDQNLIYLDGNSLGRLPKRTVSRLEDAIQRQWGERLIRAWNDGGIHAPDELGGKIAA